MVKRKNNLIYLDNAATTPVDPRVLKSTLPYLRERFGNASSLHQAGLDNWRAIDETKNTIAKFFNCQPIEIFFTSGATESDNLAIFGVLRHYQRRWPEQKWHIITSKIEHDAILEACQEAEKAGAEVTYLPVDAQGLVAASDVKQAIKSNTILVSIMYVNNEVGTIQPIAAIGALIKELNQKRDQKIYFHTDATQALPYADMNVQNLGVDLLSASAHKIYGPKGVGLIYIKKGTPLTPLFFGGHQQDNVRPGTYNVPGIVSLGAAIGLLLSRSAREKENKKIKQLRDYLINGVKRSVAGVKVTGALDNRVPGNASFLLPGVEGESVLLMLSDKNIAVSTGSACSSGSLDPSHVLLAMGIKPEEAHGSLRVTLGRFNTKTEVDAFLRELPPIVERLRKMSPLK